MSRFNADFYIHERPDWPDFRYDLEALLKPLGAARHRQGTLAGKMQGYGFDLNIEANLEALTEEVQKSSEIEGERLDREQVRSSIAQRLHIDIGALTPADSNVEGVVEMMLDATQHYDAPLTAERLFGWHTSLFASPDNIRSIQIGRWRDDRTGPMQVVSGPMGRERVHYEAPAAERLEAEMRRFMDWFNAPDALDPVLKAGISHLWFVTIHPFDDGNGRMARAIADMQLARSEGTSLRAYSMSSQIRKERKTYYDLLEETQKGDLEITGWLVWFLGCLDRALEGAESVCDAVIVKARFWQNFRATAINERQRQMLNKLLDGFEGKLTTKKWATMTKCSHDTALRDIDDLIAKGALSKDPAGGRSASYSLVAQ